MLRKLQKTKKLGRGGFTIIEVMIVLAIAGLILLIVFLAVPALQRTARNTSRKEDNAGMLAAVNNYEDNNGGSIPNQINFSAPTLTICGAADLAGCATPTDASESAKLGYYTAAKNNTGANEYTAGANASTIPTVASGLLVPGTVFIVSGYPSGSVSMPAAGDYAFIMTGASCANATTGKAASARATITMYGIESNGGWQYQCSGS